MVRRPHGAREARGLDQPYLLALCRAQATSEARAVPNLQIGKPRDVKSLPRVTANKDSTHCLLPGTWTSHPMDSRSCGPYGLDSRSLGPQTRLQSWETVGQPLHRGPADLSMYFPPVMRSEGHNSPLYPGHT